MMALQYNYHFVLILQYILLSGVKSGVKSAQYTELPIELFTSREHFGSKTVQFSGPGCINCDDTALLVVAYFPDKVLTWLAVPSYNLISKESFLGPVSAIF